MATGMQSQPSPTHRLTRVPAAATLAALIALAGVMLGGARPAYGQRAIQLHGRPLPAPPPPPPGPRLDAVDYLILQLQQAPQPGQRRAAADELGRIGDARAIHPLIEAALLDSHYTVRNHARDALIRIVGPNPPSRRNLLPAEPALVRDLAIQLLSDPRDGERRKAADRLGDLGHPAAMPALVHAAMFDRSEAVRIQARKSFLQIRDALAAGDPGRHPGR